MSAGRDPTAALPSAAAFVLRSVDGPARNFERMPWLRRSVESGRPASRRPARV